MTLYNEDGFVAVFDATGDSEHGRFTVSLGEESPRNVLPKILRWECCEIIDRITLCGFISLKKTRLTKDDRRQAVSLRA